MLSRYTNLEQIGAGGMGVVYRAEDVTLRRPVALKFLTGKSYGEEQLRARFLREARTAAALNHPSICTIYEVAEVREGEEETLGGEQRLDPGTPFLSMELIEGQTLGSRLAGGKRLGHDTLLDVAVGVAEGLAVAHAKRIVHRDLKPGNVMLTEDGRAKILDFGLAKPLGAALEGDQVLTMAETVSAELTREGRVLGTVAYMSPEQALGRPVDSRSDVFSFGIMLYEMAAGERPFRGESSTSTLAKILEADPEPLGESRSDLPPEFHRIVRRCLKKNPAERYNDTRDLVAALKDLRLVTSGTAAVVSERATLPRLRRSAVWSILTAGALVAAAGAAWYAVTGDDRSPTRQAVSVHRQVTFTGKARMPALSPDGRSIGYVQWRGEEDPSVHVQDIAGGEPLAILKTADVHHLEWSPDGSQLHVDVSLEDGESKNYLVPRLGGTPRSV